MGDEYQVLHVHLLFMIVFFSTDENANTILLLGRREDFISDVPVIAPRRLVNQTLNSILCSFSEATSGERLIKPMCGIYRLLSMSPREQSC